MDVTLNKDYYYSEIAWLIKSKFHVKPPWDGGTKVWIAGPGHHESLDRWSWSYDDPECPYMV